MSFKHKFSYEEKVKIVSEYIDGTYGFLEICRRYNINQGSLQIPHMEDSGISGHNPDHSPLQIRQELQIRYSLLSHHPLRDALVYLKEYKE